MGSSTILTTKHLEQVNASLAQLGEAEKELALAKRAGLQSTVAGQSIPELEAKIADLQGKLRAIKQVYFPNG